MKLLLLIILLIPVVCFSQMEKVNARAAYYHSLRKGQRDTMMRVVIICTKLPNQEDAPKNEIRVEGWVKKDLATFSNPNSVIDFYYLDKKRVIPEQYVNRYEGK